MTKKVVSFALAVGAMWGTALAQAPAETSVERLDPALDAIVSPTARLELLSKEPGATEGPVWVKDGQYLLFTARGKGPGKQIAKYTPNGGVSVFLEPANDAIGMGLDPEGRLILCAAKSIVRVEKDGTRTTLVDQFEGKPLNGPNDIAVKSDGSFYFTDEYSVFRWKNGSVTQLTRSVVPGGPLVDGKPVARVVNGIALSPDEKSLYLVVVPPGAPRRIIRYNLRPDGTFLAERGPDATITDERLFVSLPVQNPPATRESGQPDGIKVDVKGNVYFGGPGGLWIVSPAGTHLGTILIPGGHSNLAFGDADGRSLYITLGNGLARIRLNAPAI
jgi:gluconolactonase